MIKYLTKQKIEFLTLCKDKNNIYDSSNVFDFIFNEF